MQIKGRCAAYCLLMLSVLQALACYSAKPWLIVVGDSRFFKPTFVAPEGRATVSEGECR